MNGPRGRLARPQGTTSRTIPIGCTQSSDSRSRSPWPWHNSPRGKCERTTKLDIQSLRIPRAEGDLGDRTFFRTNPSIRSSSIGPTAFNLLGIDPLGPWRANTSSITTRGTEPSRSVHPGQQPFVEFSGSEEINNYLLSDAEVQSFISRGALRTEVRPMAMVFFDEETRADLRRTRLRPDPAVRFAASPSGFEDRRREKLGRRPAPPRCPTSWTARTPTPTN